MKYSNSTGSQAAEVSLREHKAQSSCVCGGNLIEILDELDEMRDLILVLENSIGFLAHEMPSSGAAANAAVTGILLQRIEAIQGRLARRDREGE